MQATTQQAQALVTIWNETVLGWTDLADWFVRQRAQEAGHVGPEAAKARCRRVAVLKA
jgi:hypothetical protein